MNIVVDIIIAAIIVFNIIYGWKQGFVKMALKSLVLVVALIAAFSFVNPVRNYVLETDSAENWENKIYGSVITVLDNVSAQDGQEESDSADAGKITSLLSAVGVDIKDIQADIDEWKNTKNEEIKASIAGKAAPLLLKAAVTFASFLVIFLVVYIIATVAVFLLDKFTKLPVLKQANTLLGIIVGIVLAIAEACVFVSLVQLLLPVNILGGIFAGFTPENTFLFKVFGSFNIFRMLF
ncbi:MAG: CvpA family protein [Clostridia bacterium]|nr:CvpA family protein [Clostridia bacterium]MBO7216310.1 CvpA family protein [Clostridia bacterium]MBO7246656.1 CvpA family protein [Clostridia bacterium]MBO7738314.1 CvpA family protein [Clostridia bacterium]